MPRFQEFGTFFIVPREADGFIAGLGVPRIWRLETRPDPSRRHWCDRRGHIVQVQLAVGNRPPRVRLKLARQLVICSRNGDIAGKVASLIRVGTLLGCPDLTKYPNVTDVYPVAKLPRNVITSEPFASRFHQYDGAEYGCHAAVSAWGAPNLVYALEKYRFSLERDSFTPHSAHPIHRQIFPNRYREETYHVDAAFAIVAAFSVIEELGLEVRSSQERPRFIGPHKRTWNGLVLSDIEARLRCASIDPSDTIIWIRRGSPTQVERKMFPKLGKPADWNGQFGVRDRELRIPDAIHYASWLRNFVAAHKFRVATSAISPYDVHNAQGVARRLLLGRLGVWRRFT